MTKQTALASVPVRALATSASLQDSAAPSAYGYQATFKGQSKGAQIPNFGNYMSDKAPATNKLFSYFMVGGLGAISAAGAKSTVEGRWRDGNGLASQLDAS